MPDDKAPTPNRNLHCTVTPEAMRLLGAMAKLEGRQIGVVEATIGANCEAAVTARLAKLAADAKGGA
jgi:hypothetical protein